MIEILKNTISITVFVTVMMLVIEFFNIKTRGVWSESLQKNKFLQIILATFLGLIPGCLGAYTVVSMYTHGILSFGALVASMIATFGDEAFIMFALIPSAAIKISIAIFIIAIVVGVISNFIFKNKIKSKNKHFHIHKNELCDTYEKRGIIYNLRNISFVRATLTFSILLFLFFVIANSSGHSNSININLMEKSATEVNISQTEHSETTNITTHTEEHKEHSHNAWVKITFIIILLIALAIIITVPEHFLEEHLWKHVIKKHFLKVFLWTFGVLALVFVLQKYIDIETLISDNLYIILIVAVLVGIIPESGPHLIFVSLFITGTIPISILLANSIVQDGHGALPLFAEDKKSFFIMKLINVIVGFLVGFLGLFLQF